jgi:hypothetical protein
MECPKPYCHLKGCKNQQEGKNQCVGWKRIKQHIYSVELLASLNPIKKQMVLKASYRGEVDDMNTKQICLNGHTHQTLVHLTTILTILRSACVLIYNNDFQKH